MSESGKLLFVGPTNGSVEKTLAKTAASAILTSVGSSYAAITILKRKKQYLSPMPPILLCVPHESLGEDLYEGVDDFVVVPCSSAELYKRVKRLAVNAYLTGSSSPLRTGKVTLDIDKYQVALDGKQVQLAWMEFQLLKFLMQNPGRIFTREQLLSRVWGAEDIGGTRTVDVHIRRLRRKLGVYGDELFRTVKNVGYGLLEPR